ncbi:disintegrin and metalloproteinase domain-containing protein 20-like [Marmota marmota marmota]|uniref:Disintegrin and metalloproteinase domain-containing protein 20-like n=1 Tax=Marmota marmota marmota TaxID=9994 RepID=A0A8C5ZRF9_MARMA|nr:disintegrin and metalloproteinase domain-containing protein 20-like [Marmota marmota marmota]
MGPAWVQRPLTGVLWLHVLWVLLCLVCCSHGPPKWRFTSSEVVIPKKVPQRRGEIKMPNQLAYSIRFRGQRHVIHMKLKKNLIPRHFPVVTNNDQGANQEDYPYVPQDCYYYSYLEGVPGSVATLDTCYGGLRGMLQVDDFTYEIKPLEASSKFEHVVSLLVSEDRADEDERCKIEEEETNQIPEEVNLAESPRAGPVYLWRSHMKHMKLHFTVSSSVYSQNQNQTQIIENVVIINNILDSIFRPGNLYSNIRILCIWEKEDTFNMKSYNHASTATHEFGLWKFYNLWKVFTHDTSILYLGYMVGGSKYYASHSGFCNPNWGAAYVYFENYHIFKIAAVTAHVIAHNMGIAHDDPSCVCFRRHRCVMNSIPGLLDMFSNCSYDRLHWMVHRWDPCLSLPNKPYSNFPYIANRCGDKDVNSNEQCDCGSLKECANNSCCSTNCAFTSGSTCDTGGCCDHCKFASAGMLCRDVHGICDLPEYCDGTGNNCPNDLYVQDGTPCSPLSVCVRGNCSDRDLQCQALLGYQVKDALPMCYEKLNVIGDRFGNCGLKFVRGGTKPMKCEIDDVLCGMLHCSNVQQVPGVAEHSTFHHIYVGDAKLESCFGFDTHYGEELPEVGLVVDGATCGPGQYCLNKNCTFHRDFPFTCDVKTCNYKGVCNNLEKCHCLRGWKPPDCEQKGTGGSEDSGPPPDKELSMKAKIQVTVNKGLVVILSRITAFLLVICIGAAIKAKITADAKKKAKPPKK